MLQRLKRAWRRLTEWLREKPPQGVSKEDWFDRQQW
jgi:hypothetical protein